ncbi:hypothetical protein [Paenibacillus periandrae]|uniref:hypothetical protein n=1 Tax=Paenibacillus periandrae TaxID=1761741 RepID=UPI001F08FAA7|nr:hypothetical protein [Paenibacillus periandrae]
MKAALVEAAWSASKTRSFLGSTFWSIASRHGKNKAVVAIAHKMLVIAYHILKTGEPYKELGADFQAKRRSVTHEELMIKRLQKLGYLIQKSEDPSSA